MPISTTTEWQHLALIAAGVALVLVVLMRLPFVGRVVRALFSFAMLAFAIFLLLRQAPYEPHLAALAERLGLDGQEVVGDEVRIRMAPDGHFWAKVSVNGVARRMLIDSGATVTALSDETAEGAAVDADAGLVPVVLRTANGVTPARTGSVRRLRVGGIEARNLKVVVSPALGDLDVLGMNFLSQLDSWRVEGRTLILVPRRASKSGGDAGR